MKFDTIKRYFRVFDRFITIPLVHILIVQLMWFITSSGTDSDLSDGLMFERYISVICVIVMVLFFYSLVRITTVHDPSFRQRFAERKGSLHGLKGRLSLVLGWKKFYAELAAMIALYAILPPKVYYMALCELLGADSPNLRLYYLLAVIPSIILLSFLARLGAIRSLSYGGFKQTSYDNEKAAQKGYEKALILPLLIYTVGGFMLCAMIPVLITFLPILRELATVGNIILLGIIILFPFAWRFVKAILKRRKFLKGMKRVCGSMGYTLSKIRKPYRSVFSVPSEESFTITAVNGKVYSCMFIGAPRKNDPLWIEEKGAATFTHTVRIAKVELFSRLKECDFAYESENRKVLILNPVPKKVFTIKKGQTVELDNGDDVGGYKIFTGSAFLNALEREILDRKV